MAVYKKKFSSAVTDNADLQACNDKLLAQNDESCREVLKLRDLNNDLVAALAVSVATGEARCELFADHLRELNDDNEKQLQEWTDISDSKARELEFLQQNLTIAVEHTANVCSRYQEACDSLQQASMEAYGQDKLIDTLEAEN